MRNLVVHYGYRRRARLVDPSPKEEGFRRVLKTPPEKSAFLTIEQLVCSPLLNEYDHLKEVRDCDDIGEGGLNVVRRDMDRCRRVLAALQQEDPEGRAA